MPDKARYDRVLRQVKDGPHTLTVAVQWDKRLRRTVRWTVEGDTLILRAQPGLTLARLEAILDADVLPRVLKQRASARGRQDDELARRARAINEQHFGGELRWHSIRWVSNMQRRLGSCSTGGPTDGDIRISDRLKGWPDYVLDYVIAHELAHRKHPDHSREFWEYLARYPNTERARGFIHGVAFAEGAQPDDLL